MQCRAAATAHERWHGTPLFCDERAGTAHHELSRLRNRQDETALNPAEGCSCGFGRKLWAQVAPAHACRARRTQIKDFGRVDPDNAGRAPVYGRSIAMPYDKCDASEMQILGAYALFTGKPRGAVIRRRLRPRALLNLACQFVRSRCIHVTRKKEPKEGNRQGSAQQHTVGGCHAPRQPARCRPAANSSPQKYRTKAWRLDS
eukprot:6198639-Pleurochrysis_carterae.AAC.2